MRFGGSGLGSHSGGGGGGLNNFGGLGMPASSSIPSSLAVSGARFQRAKQGSGLEDLRATGGGVGQNPSFAVTNSATNSTPGGWLGSAPRSGSIGSSNGSRLSAAPLPTPAFGETQTPVDTTGNFANSRSAAPVAAFPPAATPIASNVPQQGHTTSRTLISTPTTSANGFSSFLGNSQNGRPPTSLTGRSSTSMSASDMTTTAALVANAAAEGVANLGLRRSGSREGRLSLNSDLSPSHPVNSRPSSASRLLNEPVTASNGYGMFSPTPKASSESLLTMASQSPRPPHSSHLSLAESKPHGSLNSHEPVGIATPQKDYWRSSFAELQGLHGMEDLVVIHVCDESQHLTRDFCCRREILKRHMKYFEKFLMDNTSETGGYEDVDISVHCDVEIFEWLMSYIHDPDHPPKIDKTIVVSILISSEFLQMDSLVDHCIAQMTQNLTEIIRLPIDLSCISERLINKMVYLLSPKALTEIRDRKDKVLTKLYKRRVELDFSRKGSSHKLNLAGSASPSTMRTIASALTCCRHCGMVYLESYGSSLICRESPPIIDFRGRLISRHTAIPGWSLTSYLKTLHSGGMNWESIYWHVWAACIVLRVRETVVSALEVDRYTVEPDGIILSQSFRLVSRLGSSGNNKATAEGFSLFAEEASAGSNLEGSPVLKMTPVDANAEPNGTTRGDQLVNGVSVTLSPLRSPDTLTNEIFELITSQARHISGGSHKDLIAATSTAIVRAANQSTLSLNSVIPSEGRAREDFFDYLWAGTSAFNGAVLNDYDVGSEDAERRRGRSTGRVLRSVSQEPRRKSAARAGRDTGNGDTELDDNTADGSAAPKRRTRSQSALKRSSKPISVPAAMRVESTEQQVDEETARRLQRHLDVFKSLPPDLSYNSMSRSGCPAGPIYGVWLNTPPLQTQPSVLDDASDRVVENAALSDVRRIEWLLDLLREFDEKRMDRLGRFLISCRSNTSSNVSRRSTFNNVANQTKGKSEPSPAKRASGEYYRDRGRQPFAFSIY